MLLSELKLGSAISFNWRKWDSSPHWFHDLVFLGEDEWGAWAGQYSGGTASKPGRTIALEWDSLMLVPHDPRYVMTVNQGHPRGVEIYIDLAWDVSWDAESNSFTGIDMDLDVVRREPDGATEIVDQQEWDEHRALFSYPEPVVVQLVALARELAGRVSAMSPPFDPATSAKWFQVLQQGESRG